MPATEYQGSSVPLPSIGRSIISLRRDQVRGTFAGAGAADAIVNSQELEAFQRHAADLLHDLADGGEDGGGSELLSLTWIRRLLDTFLICLEEFRAVLFNVRDDSAGARPPIVDRLVADFFERAVKALDICNAVRDGIAQVKQWQKHIEIVVFALDPGQRSISSGQIRRARKALTDLTLMMVVEKDAGSVITRRNRSFGRNGAGVGTAHHHHRTSSSSGGGGHFRSLSWSVSLSWSAARQIQAIGSNLAAPKGGDVAATSGLAIPVFTMNTVLLFAMWSLVAAIPCQDRGGLQAHFSVPRSFLWAAPVMSMHEQIVEESKRKERKHSVGLMREIHQVERCAVRLIDLLDAVELQVVGDGDGDRETELRREVAELAGALERMKAGLDPVERQVREVFHRIVRSRTDCLDCGMLHQA